MATASSSSTTTAASSTSSNTTPDIVIVGAGLAGLATSLGLSKLGYKIEIVEQRMDWERRGSAFGLAPNGLKALQEICPPVVAERLKEQGIYMEKMNSGGYFLGWWMVRDALLEPIEANENIRLRLGYSVAGFSDTTDDSCIEIQLNKTDHSSSEEESSNITLKAKLLVAADGLYSTCRKILGLPAAKSIGKTRWRGSLTVPRGSPLEPYLEKGVAPFFAPDTPDIVKEMTTGTAMVTLFNLHQKVPRRMPYSLLVDMEVPPGTHAREIFDPRFQDPVQQALLQELWEHSDVVDLTTPLPVSVVDLEESTVAARNSSGDGSTADNAGWGGRGRVTIIGDAAHAMRPASGLGGAMAFEDAVVLCRCLQQQKKKAQEEEDNNSTETNNFLETRASANELVMSFENSRIDRVAKIWKNQWEISENAYKKERIPMTPEFRKWVYEGV